MGFYKMLDGLSFRLEEVYSRKLQAQDHAARLWRHGYYARVELHRDKHTHKDMWAVYARRIIG